MKATDEAIVLAGGLGTRLRGVVDGVPKPLALVAGRPFLAWLLDALAMQGLRRVVLATGYRGEQIEAALGATWRGMALVYSRERKLLGTGGAIALAMPRIAGDDCFVLNGDTWLELDYARFDAAVRGVDARLGVALAAVPEVARYGAVNVEEGRVVDFVEKGQSGPGFINAGVYLLSRSLLEDFPSGEPFSFEHDVLRPAAARETVVACTDTEGFIDIGVPDDYRQAQTRFAARRGGT
ncbi:MAG TPA: nucleotidyltransferase family protein [Rhodanobacteraceae bacterium]|nr:nucleotidyltransferase family protein [Rhodanobacteraceae bacterium]